MKSGAFAIERVLRQAVENRESHEQRRELWVVHHFEMKLLLRAAGDEREVERNHWRRRAELACNSGEMVAGDRPDGAADVDDFGGGEFGGKCRDHLRASHGELDVAETQEGVTAEVDLIGADRGYGARGTDRGVALNENHACHVARDELSVVGFGCGGAALRRDEAVALELRSELAKSFGLITGENKRSLDGFESRAGGQAGVGGCGLGKGKLWGDRLIRIGFSRELR